MKLNEVECNILGRWHIYGYPARQIGYTTVCGHMSSRVRLQERINGLIDAWIYIGERIGGSHRTV